MAETTPLSSSTGAAPGSPGPQGGSCGPACRLATAGADHVPLKLATLAPQCLRSHPSPRLALKTRVS